MDKTKSSAVPAENEKAAHMNPSTRQALAGLVAEGARFVGSGALLVFPLGLLVSALLHEVVGLPEEIAAGVAFCVMLLVGFVLARSYIFRAGGSVQRQLPRFALISLAMRSAEYLLFLLLFRFFGMSYVLAMICAVGTSACFKYFLYRVWVFERPLSARQ